MFYWDTKAAMKITGNKVKDLNKYNMKSQDKDNGTIYDFGLSNHNSINSKSQTTIVIPSDQKDLWKRG